MNKGSVAIDEARFQDVVIFVLGTMRTLEDKGLVAREGGTVITDTGMAEYWRLKAAGFMATPEEIGMCVEMFRKIAVEEE